MKKTYANPELVVIALDAKDIVTASEVERDQGLWQPYGSDQDWDTVLNGYTKIL